MVMGKTAVKMARIPTEVVERRIYLIQGLKAMIDSDLAESAPANLNLAVRRNANRFPADFMFQLTPKEVGVLRLQTAISKTRGSGGRRSRPYAFAEHGVAMLSSVLRSKRAVRSASDSKRINLPG